MLNAGKPILVPGTPVPPVFPLARYRSPHLTGAIREFLRSTTRPGDLVLIIGATGATPIVEAASIGRRAVLACRNPVELLWTRTDLESPPIEQVQAALTQLGDSPKAGHPLMRHIQDLYRSHCPHCGNLGIAEWFVWDRHTKTPIYKRVICEQCGIPQEGKTDDHDVERAGTFPIQGGPIYHLALSRVVSQGSPLLPRVIELIQLYTPRNLTALMDLINRLPHLRVSPQVRHVIDGLILEALDLGSALVPYNTPPLQPRSLRPPARFMEHNIWMLLDKAVATYTRSRSLPRQQDKDIGPESPSLASLMINTTGGYRLLSQSVAELQPEMLNDNIRALIFGIQAPDAPFMALSVLWGTWIWGTDAARTLRHFLGRRRLDWEWYRRAVAWALRHLRHLLPPGTPVLILTWDPDPGAIRTAVHSATAAGLKIDRWIACHPQGYRLLWQAQTAVPRTIAREATTETELANHAAELATTVLRQRGEPTPRRQVESTIVLTSGEPDLPAPDPKTMPNLVVLSRRRLLWLRTAPQTTTSPLGDRVEEYILALLQQRSHWRPQELTAAVYAEFSGLLSPEPSLVKTCIEAYTMVLPNGSLTLRTEDDPKRRRAELRQLREIAMKLGNRLGYNVSRRLGGDITWRYDHTTSYVFRFTTTAVLGPHLLKSPPQCDGWRCLVLPGGRAALTVLKLQRDPRLQDLATAHQWTFIKFRHLRRMAQEIQQRGEVNAFLKLDPIAGKDTTQLPLPIERGGQKHNTRPRKDQ